MDISIVVTNALGTRLNELHLSDLDQEDINKAIAYLEKTFKPKKASYDFSRLKVGEHSAYPIKGDPIKIMSAAYMYGKRTDKKFKCVTLSNQMVRVTRTQ